jgi:hypothetical protein
MSLNIEIVDPAESKRYEAKLPVDISLIIAHVKLEAEIAIGI